jgi:GNAT superfamily N-acetyltransferase
MPSRLTIREVRSASDPAFDAAHRLFRRIFPRAELLPKREWAYAMRERDAGLWTDIDWHMLVAERGGKLLGAASGSYVGNINVGVIGYIAVTPRTRSFGIGPKLRRKLRVTFERDARRVRGRPLKALVGEVRPDNPWLRSLVRREGAVALDFPYYQPSLHRSAKPVPLVLYYQPLGTRRSSLPATEVRRLLYTMWRRPYRVARPLSRVPFRRMLKSLEGRRTIGQRPLPPPPHRAAPLVS